MKFFRILIVEDDITVREIIKEIVALAFISCEVLSAGNSNEAIKILAEYPVDLVITDYDMPFVNGKELTGFIKNNYPKIKVILMSAEIDINKIRGMVNADLVVDKLDFIYIKNIKFYIDKIFKGG